MEQSDAGQPSGHSKGTSRTVHSKMINIIIISGVFLHIHCLGGKLFAHNLLLEHKTLSTLYYYMQYNSYFGVPTVRKREVIRRNGQRIRVQ